MKITKQYEQPGLCKGADSHFANELLLNLEKLHTTELGKERVKRNLSLNTEDVVAWCKNIILGINSEISRKGKNWYICADGCEITVNAYSYTIITAHKVK